MSAPRCCKYSRHIYVKCCSFHAWPTSYTSNLERLQIHDELVLEVNRDEKQVFWLKEIAVKSCCRDCEKIFKLTVPLVLDCTVGYTWSSQSMRPIGGAKG